MVHAVVQCHGVFDLLHYGHLKHLQYARTLGEKLVVTITADRWVQKEGRPIYNQNKRREMLIALRCVDEVIIIAAQDAITAIKAVNPDIYVKGAEYEGNLPEHHYCDTHGIKTVFYSATDDRTTNLLKHHSAI